MPASIKDIARKVGVSISTVSYALNGGPKPVAAPLKERILTAAAELNYRPSRVAQRLVTKRSDTVAVYVPRVASSLPHSSFVQLMLGGVLQEASAFGLDVLLFTSHKQDTAHQVEQSLLDGRADGCVFIGEEGVEGALDRLIAEGANVTAVGVSPRAGVGCVACDNRAGVAAVVEHLTELGHTRIGHLHGRLSHWDGAERLQAFRQELQQRNLDIREEWIADGCFEPEPSIVVARDMLSQKDRPTALFCANDESALATLRVARALGLKVPLDLSVVGYDDSPFADLATPPLTSVRQPSREMASLAVQMLVRRMNGEIHDFNHAILQPTLVVRASTARPSEAI